MWNVWIDKMIAFDLTAPFVILVWVGTGLGVAWTAAIMCDPINKTLPWYYVLARRLSVVIIQAGLLLTILLADRQSWGPWPSMLVVAFGVDLYYAASLWAYIYRCQLYRALRERYGSGALWPIIPR